MRIVTALLLLLLAPAALAQPCDPAHTNEACTDTTTWQRYVPLAVGNIWQYQDNFYDEPVAHWSWTVTGEVELGGQTYVTLERCDEAADGSATCAEPIPIRYDAEHAMIVRRDGDEEAWWNETPCRLDVEFNGAEETYACTGPGTEETQFTPAWGAYEATIEVPPDELSGDTHKQIEWFARRGWELYAGLGVTKFFYELQGEPTRLVYANVDGEQVGTPAFASCDPSNPTEIACPDTTDWRRYMPLEVGNEWQYREAFDSDDVVYWGWRITGETEIAGRTYVRIERCREGADGTVTCGDPVPVRYHDEYSLVVQHTEDGDTWWDGVPCRLDLPFGSAPAEEEYECEGSGSFFFYLGAEGEYEAPWNVPPVVASGDTRKTIYTPIFETIHLYAGLGLVSYEDEAHPEPTRLVYARVSGETTGTPAFTFPTSGEPDAGQPTVSAFTALFPNPAREAATAHYTLDAPQAVTLELIDLLGRRVRSAEMGPQAAGAHDVRIDMRGLRPGLYVLRLRGEAGAEAVRRVVVMR